MKFVFRRFLNTMREFSSTKNINFKNKFFGDGVEFFKNALHKDNLPFVGIGVGCVYFVTRGYTLEHRVEKLEEKVDLGFSELESKMESRLLGMESRISSMESKMESRLLGMESRMDSGFSEMREILDRHFAVIMTFTAIRKLPEEISNSTKDKKESEKDSNEKDSL